MDLPAKLKALRACEGLTQNEFCQELQISLSTYKKQELSLRSDISSTVLLKVTNHPRFQKYTLWLMTGETAPEAGQISPL
ncbi:helix-turn-helix domain-containing protein [Pseudomonas sp.]|uniref:helix-turn-helix domain-containing protein n=1 Tax=Pseudomonas sp. TaxID=306 RepID=UPI003D0A83E0